MKRNPRPARLHYSERRIALLRGIGPHVALYYLLGLVISVGGLFLLAALIAVFR